jgi:hypothetical protein
MTDRSTDAPHDLAAAASGDGRARVVERPELVTHVGPDGAEDPSVGDDGGPDDQVPSRKESVSEPAKVMRIGSMIKQLLEELRNTELDEPSRERLRSIHATAIAELAQVLSPDLRAELESFALPFDDEAPTELELRVAQAQLVGWLEGLFQGIQLTLFSQQMAARAQLENMREQAKLGGGPPEARPGTYL